MKKMTNVIKETRETDLHMDLRVSNPGCLFRQTPVTVEMQENLQRDVKALVSEYIHHMKMPQIEPELWQTAIIEIISENTNRYIQELESILQEVVNKTKDKVLSDWIDCVLRSRTNNEQAPSKVTNYQLNNAQALTSALLRIRSEASNCQRILSEAGVENPAAMESAALIEELADRMHNIPGMMLDGIQCDGLYLLRHGVDKNWPTGIPDVNDLSPAP